MKTISLILILSSLSLIGFAQKTGAIEHVQDNFILILQEMSSVHIVYGPGHRQWKKLTAPGIEKFRTITNALTYLEDNGWEYLSYAGSDRYLLRRKGEE